MIPGGGGGGVFSKAKVFNQKFGVPKPEKPPLGKGIVWIFFLKNTAMTDCFILSI